MDHSEKSVQSDEDLVALVTREDHEALRRLIERYQNKLYRYVLGHLGDEDRAQDIVQDAFIKMYTNINSFDTSRTFSPWAYRITHNVMISHIRKYKNEIKIDDEVFTNLPDPRPSLSDDIDRKLTAGSVRSHVRKLPQKYQEVILLYYFEGKDYQEISVILELTSATVATRLRRAKARLKRLLENEASS